MNTKGSPERPSCDHGSGIFPGGTLLKKTRNGNPRLHSKVNA